MKRELELAWLAGFLDGEGCFSIQGGRPSLRVHTADEKSVRRVADIARCGRVNTYVKPAPRCAVWAWWAPRADLRQLLVELRPYLVTKARECGLLLACFDGADVAEELRACKTKPGHRRTRAA